jgi:hypothetical protein
VSELVERLGPVARELLEYWTRLPKHGCVPHRRDFDPMAIVRILPVVSLIQRTTEGAWQFRIAGTEIERRWERKLTGQKYLEIDIVSRQAAETMRREFEFITTWPCASWSLRRVELRSGRRAVIETLRVPLRAADDRISQILSCSGELDDRSIRAPDGAREIIMITEQEFLDIGAGCPDQRVLLGATPA